MKLTFGVLFCGLTIGGATLSSGPMDGSGDCLQEYECGPCALGPTGYHYFSFDGEDNATCISWKEECNNSCHYREEIEGHCFETHYEYCEPSEEDVEQDLFSALRSGAADKILAAVQAAFDAHSESVKLVAERHAWQVEGCSGLVIAHVPIPEPLDRVPD